MKKVAFIFVVVFSIVLLSSCTDTTKELEERIVLENETKLINKDDIQHPDDRD